MTTWKPQRDSKAILDFAMAKIKSVPYKVSSRWAFYRVLQAGLVSDKSFITKFDYVTSRARKSFYGEWRPDTLIDSIRSCEWKGEFDAYFGLQLDSASKQDFYVQCWFEAEAMHGQFEHYTEPYRVSLVPFRGDISIPMKWQLAKKLEQACEKYGKPIKVLYFGDYDKKGFQIIEAALRDIRAWCKIDFDVERVGLTLEQAKSFGLPENPDHPDAYQWEALEDEQAKQLILDSLSKYAKPISSRVEEQEKTLRDKIRSSMTQILEGVSS
jgi:hypothetical protein